MAAYKIFNTVRQAVDYINEKGIAKESIVSFFEKEGRYYLVYYKENVDKTED